MAWDVNDSIAAVSSVPGKLSYRTSPLMFTTRAPVASGLAASITPDTTPLIASELPNRIAPPNCMESSPVTSDARSLNAFSVSFVLLRDSFTVIVPTTPKTHRMTMNVHLTNKEFSGFPSALDRLKSGIL
ncbi:hypothetical protein [Roseobacter denitrificans]|uniref:hypothetical protein n=1 Tax=Roseobacter denitrificans TaxID=2434 RepID=UPI001FEB78EC|nr:hypothetical protein [Roseobacter denitrificans]